MTSPCKQAFAPGRLPAQPRAAEGLQAILLRLAGFSRVLVSLRIKGIQLTGFHKAFDKISQQMLLKKLCCQGWEEMPF